MPSEPTIPPTQAINREKWTPELVRAGWVLLPNVIIEKQRELGLDSVDLNIILHLACHWWTPHTDPCPSKARMAAAMGLSARTLQRRLTSLDKRGLVTRTIRGTADAPRTTNSYSLRGLIQAATPLADDMARQRAKKRRTRKLPEPTPFDEVTHPA